MSRQFDVGAEHGTRRDAGTATNIYRFPAEWSRHDATWIAWPHHEPDWPGKLEPIPWVYAEIVRHLAASETVCLLVADAKMRERARRLLRRAGMFQRKRREWMSPYR